MDDINIISNYTVNICCKFMVDTQCTIDRIPLYAEVRNEEGAVIGYRQMSNEDIDQNIWLHSDADGFITLADFKKKYILSLT